MKFRIVTGKQPETYDVEADTGFNKTFKKMHIGFVSEHEATMKVAQLQEELRGMALWQPGLVIKEFDE